MREVIVSQEVKKQWIIIKTTAPKSGRRDRLQEVVVH